MIAAAQHITQVLTSVTSATDLDGKVFWEMADSEEKYPFLNYSVLDMGPATKSGYHTYQAQVRIYASSLTAGARLAQGIIIDIKENSSWRYRNGRSTYSDSDAKEAYIELTFEFKHNN